MERTPKCYPDGKDEVWKIIPQTKGRFMASTWSRIKRLEYTHVDTLGRTRTYPEEIKEGTYDNDGRNYITINRQRQQRIAWIAATFLGYELGGFDVVSDHDDDDHTNDAFCNIALITHRGNIGKGFKTQNLTSKFTGVSWAKAQNKWMAQIKYKKRDIHLGYFDVELDAHNAYQKALKELEAGEDLNLLYPKGRNKSSKYKGVYWIKSRNKWRAYKTINGKRKHLGYFDTEEQAHQAVINYTVTI